MKKQTAVEWLFEQIKLSSKKTDNINNDHLFFYRMFEQAKQMEKEQISEAYRIGVEEDVYNNPLRTGEQYYNETYNS